MTDWAIEPEMIECPGCQGWGELIIYPSTTSFVSVYSDGSPSAQAELQKVVCPVCEGRKVIAKPQPSPARPPTSAHKCRNGARLRKYIGGYGPAITEITYQSRAVCDWLDQHTGPVGNRDKSQPGWYAGNDEYDSLILFCPWCGEELKPPNSSAGIP